MKSATAFLMYHELELPGRDLCLSDLGYRRYVLAASDFERQMRKLKNLGYQGASVGAALDFSGLKQVAITFDDGCETDLITAAPILSELGFSATFFVTVGFMGRRGSLTASQLLELSGCGFEIGCHSMTHPYLPDLDSAGLQFEIVDAKLKLENMLGRKIEHFSCPGGRYDQRVIEVVHQTGYRTMSTSQMRMNSRDTDFYALGRIAVLRDMPAEQVVKIADGSGMWKMNFKQGVRDAAKNIFGNSLYDRLRSGVLGDRDLK
jgi:peptidoglycan/xylan/chitin deacetylase (PgdA/CDA1 family)